VHASAAEARDFAGGVEAVDRGSAAVEGARLEVGLDAAERLPRQDVQLDRDQRPVGPVEESWPAMDRERTNDGKAW
jgi:hypothetical protein